MIIFRLLKFRYLEHRNRIIVSGIKETITGGGSYMFNNTQFTGISFGLERLTALAKIKLENKKRLNIATPDDLRQLSGPLSGSILIKFNLAPSAEYFFRRHSHLFRQIASPSSRRAHS